MAEKKKAKSGKTQSGIKAVKGVGLSESISKRRPNRGLLHQVVNAQLAKRRRGTHKTKTKAEVRGGGRKPFKQKGTGRARPGSTRSPLWRGGGTMFGPQPRSYEQGVNKKVAKLALADALASKEQAGQVTVVESMPLPETKTKYVRAAIAELGATGSVLIVTAAYEKNLTLAARNLPGVKVLPAGGLNPYDVLRYETLVVLKDAMDGIEKRAAA